MVERLENNYLQNHGKRHSLARLFDNRSLLMDSMKNNNADIELRYLGGWLHYRGSNVSEMKRRISAVHTAWHKLGAFWTSKVNFKRKALAFNAITEAAIRATLHSYLIRRITQDSTRYWPGMRAFSSMVVLLRTMAHRNLDGQPKSITKDRDDVYSESCENAKAEVVTSGGYST